MEGLDIVTTSGQEIEVHGPVVYKPNFKCYYCNGESWPEEIVSKVYGDVKEI